jgi:hypothetical protein
MESSLVVRVEPTYSQSEQRHLSETWLVGGVRLLVVCVTEDEDSTSPSSYDDSSFFVFSFDRP